MQVGQQYQIHFKQDATPRLQQLVKVNTKRDTTPNLFAELVVQHSYKVSIQYSIHNCYFVHRQKAGPNPSP